MKKLFQAYRFILYFFRSKNEHGVHSPFVFELVTQVIYNDKDYYAYKKIRELRHELLGSDQGIHCEEMGAGSGSRSRTVSELIKNAAKPPKYGQLLFRLANHFQAGQILELGTSLGMSTCYLAMANSRSKVISIEGCEEAAGKAQENFKKLELANISQRVGNFDSVLPEVLKELDKLDLVFFDGNHRKDPTMAYFRQCLSKTTEESVFIFDDIYWSPEMKEAWEEIKKHKEVTVTVDLFYLGIVFFRKEQVKQHFVIRF